VSFKWCLSAPPAYRYWFFCKLCTLSVNMDNQWELKTYSWDIWRCLSCSCCWATSCICSLSSSSLCHWSDSSFLYNIKPLLYNMYYIGGPIFNHFPYNPDTFNNILYNMSCTAYMLNISAYRLPLAGSSSDTSTWSR